MSKKRKEELAFFLNERGRVTYPFIILMGILFFVIVPMLVGMYFFKRKELK